MHIIIIGAGKTGKHVIQAAIEDGNEVYVIEKNTDLAQRTAASHDCIVIHADASNIETLREAKADKADALVVTTNDDAVNMLVILLAKQLGVKRLVSSVNNDDHFPIFEQMGIDTVESPYRLNGRFLYRAIKGPKVKEFLDLGDGIEIIELRVSEKSILNQMLIKEINKQRILPRETRIIVIKRNNKIIIPEGETDVRSGDLIAALVLSRNISAVAKLFNGAHV
jgi:trk system potassium uptake protein TrkA